MDLTRKSATTQEKLHGRGSFIVTAGNDLKITGDEDILEEEVPAGKNWQVTVEVYVTEVTA